MKAIASWACSGARHAAGPDRPDRLVGDHDLRRAARRGRPRGPRWTWWRSLRSVVAVVALLLGLAHAQDRHQPGRPARPAPSARAPGRSRRTARRRSECPSTTPWTPSSTSIGAEISPVKAPSGSWCMFCAYTSTREPRALSIIARRSVKGTQIAEVDPVERGHQRQQRLDEVLGLLLGLVHLPVARDQRGPAPSAERPPRASQRLARPGAALPRAARASRRPRSRGGRRRPRRPQRRSAAAESPPPTTVSAGLPATASATARVPAANGSSSKAPIGPFQKTVPAPAISRA